MVGWVGVEDVHEEISIFDSHHCFEGFIFGFRKVIMDEEEIQIYTMLYSVRTELKCVPR